MKEFLTQFPFFRLPVSRSCHCCTKIGFGRRLGQEIDDRACHNVELKALYKSFSEKATRPFRNTKMQRLQTVLFSLVLALAILGRECLASLYDDDKNVVKLDKFSTFERKVLQGDGIWIIQFFSPTCPHCQNVVPEYKKMAEIVKGIFHVAIVDMSTEAGQRIAATKMVDSFPTFYMYGDDKKDPKAYTGARDAQNMLQALLDFSLNVLRVRAGDPSAGYSSSSGSSSRSGSSGAGGGKSKVVQLTSANFQKEVLDNPLVSLVACKYVT